jgi:hypothetical protein
LIKRLYDNKMKVTKNTGLLCKSNAFPNARIASSDGIEVLILVTYTLYKRVLYSNSGTALQLKMACPRTAGPGELLRPRVGRRFPPAPVTAILGLGLGFH